jgi:hypothetical protein
MVKLLGEVRDCVLRWRPMDQGSCPTLSCCVMSVCGPWPLIRERGAVVRTQHGEAREGSFENRAYI